MNLLRFELRVGIKAGWRIETVISNPVMYDADHGREIGWAGLAVRIEEKEGVIHTKQSSS